MRFGRTKLTEVISSISGRIEVWDEGDERKLTIEGATQSIARQRGDRRGYWERLVPEEELTSVLILGLGGGTIARWILEDWPRTKVVAYELDPEVVRVARQFMELPDEVEVRIRDFHEGVTADEQYDLVIVDLYSGYQFLPEAESEETLTRIRNRLKPGGRAAFNRVGVLVGPGGLGEFEDRLRRIFREVSVEKVNLNRIFWGKT